MIVHQPPITTSPARLSGAPAFAATRVPVQALIEYLTGEDTLEAFLGDFPSVSREHAVAILDLAASALAAPAPARQAAASTLPPSPPVPPTSVPAVSAPLGPAR